jgi:hypothetical protein
VPFAGHRLLSFQVRRRQFQMRRPVRSRAPVPLQRWQYRQARPDGERWRPAPSHLRQAVNGQYAHAAM